MGKGSPPRSPRPSSPPLNLNTASMSAGDKGERHGKGGGGGGGGRRRSNSRPENAETKLFVGNLNYATTQRTLNTYFEQFGDIQEVGRCGGGRRGGGERGERNSEREEGADDWQSALTKEGLVVRWEISPALRRAKEHGAPRDRATRAARWLSAGPARLGAVGDG